MPFKKLLDFKSCDKTLSITKLWVPRLALQNNCMQAPAKAVIYLNSVSEGTLTCKWNGDN